MSKRFWHVSTNIIGTDKCYQAYRPIAPKKPDHNGNREYDSKVYEDKLQAEARCRELNAPLLEKVQDSRYMYGERYLQDF